MLGRIVALFDPRHQQLSSQTTELRTVKMPLLNQKTQHIQVGEEGEGQRVDNWLFKRLKHVPKSRIYRMVRGGEVRVNKGRVKADTRLTAGDWVRIPPHQHEAPPPSQPQTQRHIEQLESNILFEDRELLILNKPAGWPVHGGSQHSMGVIDVLRQARPHDTFLELVHRLDKGTSGCLALAKKRSTLVRLQEVWGSQEVQKTYQGLVWGNWSPPHAVTLSIARCSGKQAGPHARIDPEGKAACTWFKRIASHAGITWVEARLGTGRTHQIRLHTNSQGHPILGDTRYGHHASNREAEALGWEGMALHASCLVLPGWAPFQAPVPASWQRFLDRWSSA